MSKWLPALIGVSALLIVAADIVAAMGRRPGGGVLSRFITGVIATAMASDPRPGGSAALLLPIPCAWLAGAAGGAALVTTAWSAAGWPDAAAVRTFALGLVGTTALCSAVFLYRVLRARLRRNALLRLGRALAKTPESAAAWLSSGESPYRRDAVEALVCTVADDHLRVPVLHLAGGTGAGRLIDLFESLRDAYALLSRTGERRDLQPLRSAVAAYLRSAESLSRPRAGQTVVYHRSRGHRS